MQAQKHFSEVDAFPFSIFSIRNFSLRNLKRGENAPNVVIFPPIAHISKTFDVCVYICKLYFFECLICNISLRYFLSDVIYIYDFKGV